METAINIMKIFWIIVIINCLIIFYPLLLMPFKKIKNMISIKKETINAYMSDGTMEREINLKYSPAFISLLLDGNVEPPKDLIADILNLIYKKVIIVEQNNNRLQIDYIKLKETKISKDELYIIKHIENILSGNNVSFDFEKFEKTIKEEFVESEFDIKDKLKKYLKGLPKALMYAVRNWNVIILLFSLPLAIIFSTLAIGNIISNKYIFAHIFVDALFYFEITAVSFVIVTFFCKWFLKRIKNIMKPPIVLSEKGKEEYRKILKFKYFLEEYTLIKNKDMESVVLWDWYLPYAVAIGANKGYKKDIEKICKDLNIEKLLLDVFRYELKRNYII